MGGVQLPDGLQRVIERQVAEGRASSPTAFLEEAVMRLVDETSAEEADVQRTVQGGSADIDAGRYRTVAGPDDERRLRDDKASVSSAHPRVVAYRLARTAEDQIDALLLNSAREHGLGAADRYDQLVLTAMAALGDEPCMIGSVAVARLLGIRAYPARLAEQRIESARRVASPRHLVIYRLAADGVVEILGLVHDRMVLSRAAGRIVRTSDKG